MRIQPNLAQNVQPEIKAIGEALETLNAIERAREMTFADQESPQKLAIECGLNPNSAYAFELVSSFYEKIQK